MMKKLAIPLLLFAVGVVSGVLLFTVLESVPPGASGESLEDPRNAGLSWIWLGFGFLAYELLKNYKEEMNKKKQKKADLKKIEWAKSKGAATDWELQHARLDVNIAELSFQAAKLDHNQYKRRFRQAQSQLERQT